MIYLEIRERLGNQLFQYAFARKMALQYNEVLAINFDAVYSRNKKEQGWDNALEDYMLSSYRYYDKKEYAFYQKAILRYVRKRIKSKNDIDRNLYLISRQKILNRFGIFFLYDGYFEFYKAFPIIKDKILIGYFESAKYFSEINDDICKEFTPKHKMLRENKTLYRMICETESVCVSIRRGDFLSLKEKDQVYICDEQYFSDAIKRIRELVPNAVLFIFSDEVDWVKKNMSFPGLTFFERGTDPTWEKLRLMSSCKHFIISNSTFSWWAQHLAANKNKVVIAPEKWRKNGRTIDIYEDNWICINVDRD